MLSRIALKLLLKGTYRDRNFNESNIKSIRAKRKKYIYKMTKADRETTVGCHILILNHAV
jgi:hypothetical protein